MTFKQKWENYWYHYKWVTIFGVFVVLFAIIWLESCANKTQPDLCVVYLSNSAIAQNDINKIENDLVANAVVKDIDEDGKTIARLECFVSDFQADSNDDPEVTQKRQVVISGGQYTLMLVHKYALEDYDGYFENLSDKVKDGDKTFESLSEGFACAISVEGNQYLESMGINTQNLYVAVRRRTDEDIKKKKDQEYFDLAYKTMDYILGCQR